ncbi:TPA: hypothetical protein ACOQZT_004896, partial [Serratia odorifera]
ARCGYLASSGEACPSSLPGLQSLTWSVLVSVPMRREMEGSLARADISEKVIQLFVDIIGFIDRRDVTEQTDFIHDFDIIDDDVTCFVMQIKWQFKLQATQEDWDHITTLEQIVDLIVQHSTLR